MAFTLSELTRPEKCMEELIISPEVEEFTYTVKEMLKAKPEATRQDIRYATIAFRENTRRGVFPTRNATRSFAARVLVASYTPAQAADTLGRIADIYPDLVKRRPAAPAVTAEVA